MNVRPLTVEEIPSLADMGAQFYAEGNLPGRFVPEVFVATWNTLYSLGVAEILGLFRDDGELLGVLGGIVSPDPNDGDLVAMEMFWFVRKEARGRGLLLIDAYEKWARARGAKRAMMGLLKALAPEVLQKTYLRRGYSERETQFQKDL